MRLVTRSFSSRGALGAGLALAVTGFALTGSGCTSAQMAGDSPAYLIIDSLKAASGANPTEVSNTLASDVQTKGGVLEDVGEATFRVALKDPGSTDSPLVPTTSNYITVTRYHVQYVRSDGHNVQGVDVPYAFDGAATASVTGAGGSTSLVLVRIQAKLEQPLMSLRGLGGSVAISTIAQVTFYGHDQAGHDVSATGLISVNFADWADPS
jgi:hypothetical protein